MKQLLFILSFLPFCASAQTTVVRSAVDSAGTVVFSQNLSSRSQISYVDINRFTITTGVGAGAGATVTVVGSMQAGMIEVTTGTGCDTMGIVIELMNLPSFPHGIAFLIWPENDEASGIAGPQQVKTKTTVDGTANIQSGKNALYDNRTYRWFYKIEGY